MKSFQPEIDMAHERLADSGFLNRGLDEITSSLTVQTVESASETVPYMVVGNLATAQGVVLRTLNYSTSLSDASVQVALSAQQEALGEDYVMVGVQVYDPKHLRLDRLQRKQVARGDFRPFSARMLSVIDELSLDEDQAMHVFGFSMGADVGMQTVYDIMRDENRGAREVTSLGVIEPARVMKRSALAVTNAFASSGKELFNNVVASDSVALLEARGIDMDNPKTQKLHDKAVASAVVSYNLADVRGNLSIVRGFGTNNTMRQLDEIVDRRDAPMMVLGRAENSDIFPEQTFKAFNYPGLDKLIIPSDHSAGDRLAVIAALTIRATQPS